ncbi:chitinase, partial [Vibrio rotiferianus]
MKKTLLAAALFTGLTGMAQAEQKVVAGYFADWQYANADNPYTVKDIPADNLTHIIYAFLSMCGPHTGAPETIQKLVAKKCEGKEPYSAILVDTEAALEKDFGPVSV